MSKENKNQQGLKVKSDVQAGKTWINHYLDCRQVDEKGWFDDFKCTFTATWKTMRGE